MNQSVIVARGSNKLALATDGDLNKKSAGKISNTKMDVVIKPNSVLNNTSIRVNASPATQIAAFVRLQLFKIKSTVCCTTPKHTACIQSGGKPKITSKWGTSARIQCPLTPNWGSPKRELDELMESLIAEKDDTIEESRRKRKKRTIESDDEEPQVLQQSLSVIGLTHLCKEM